MEKFGKKLKQLLAGCLVMTMMIRGMYLVTDIKGEEALVNVANERNAYTYMTSNANTGSEGFCYIGNGFSAINTCNENLGNGNNMLGKTASTEEVAIYVDLGSDYDINSALIYQGSTNSKYYDSYCTKYSIYYSDEQVSIANKGNITWNLAGVCTNGTIYSGAKVKHAEDVSESGDSIAFGDTYVARSIKVVFDKDFCMGTGVDGNNTGTLSTVSLLSVRIYGKAKETATTGGNTGATTDVLFIGNSMTYYNTLCKVVEGVAELKGHKISCTAVTNGGKNLIYQSTASNVLNAIKKGGYEVVVLQDIVGSFDADNLQVGAENIISIIKEYNADAKIIFYEPWPTKSTILGETGLLPYFTHSYINTAKSMKADLAPAGETFYEVYKDYGLNYYCNDGKHPQPLGTFISAATIYHTMYPGDTYSDFSTDNQTYLDNLINTNVAYTSEGVMTTYNIEVLNLIWSLGYKYSQAVISAVQGESVYTSAGGNYADPDEGMNPDGLVAVTGKGVNSDLFTKENGNIAVSCDAFASSQKQSASYATDGKTSTRWESTYSDPQWLYIDLGSERQFNKVGFIWEGAYASRYYVQISNNAVNWKTVAVVRANSKTTVQIELGETYTARYVRMYGTKRGTVYGYSLYEMGVWCDGAILENGSISGANGKTDTEIASTVKVPGKTKIRKVLKKRNSRTLKVTLKKVRKATGYQICVYKTRKSAKNNKNVIVKKFTKKINVLLKSRKIKNRKKIFVKARAYIKNDTGNKIYSKWSKVKKVNIK